MLAAETATASGNPARSERAWIVEPALPRSTGLEPGHGSSILARTQAPSTIARLQARRPLQPSRPVSRSANAAAVRLWNTGRTDDARSGAGPERWRKIPPRTPAGQDTHDRGEHRTRGYRGSATTLRTRFKLHNQRLHKGPQLIRNHL